MRIPNNALKCVVFLGITERVPADGKKPAYDRPRYAGTGFFVAWPSARIPGMSFNYLVTAAHVADKIEGNFWVRQNLTDGPAVPVEEGSEWVRHPDGKSVDVAVLPWPLPDEVDQLSISIEWMLKSRAEFEARGVGIGDEVFLAGVFARADGKTRNMPIVRKGNIAMMPQDKIYTSECGEIDAYLIEVRSFGGISGAPVWVRETVTVRVAPQPPDTAERPPQQTFQFHTAGTHYLIGLAHGHYRIDEADLNAEQFRSPAPDEPGENLGIAIVIPAEKIVETLAQPSLAKARADVEDAILREQGGPVADSALKAGGGPGREPDRLVIDDTFEGAAKKLTRAPRPPGGFPKPGGRKRKKR